MIKRGRILAILPKYANRKTQIIAKPSPILVMVLTFLHIYYIFATKDFRLGTASISSSNAR